MLVQIRGNGQVDSVKLKHLKPLIILSDWEGSLSRKKVKGFEEDSVIKFNGKAEEAKEIESINFDTFQARVKIFIGFLENKSLFNRIEGNISEVENLKTNPYPVKFKCENVKVPFRDW